MKGLSSQKNDAIANQIIGIEQLRILIDKALTLTSNYYEWRMTLRRKSYSMFCFTIFCSGTRKSSFQFNQVNTVISRLSSVLHFMLFSLFLLMATSSQASTVIVLMDGTWNEPNKVIADVKGSEEQTTETWEVTADTGEESNVAILNRYLLNYPEKQKVLYFEGIGTEGGYLKKVKDGAFGSSANEKILKAYEKLSSYLASTHDSKDYIAILGFSRGATTSRLLANKIAKEGINGKDVEIAFLGLWDTVAALGIPKSRLEEFRKEFDKKYKELIIPKSVKEVVHFVSIDEVRSTFEPTLLNLESPLDTNAKEIWYPGGHSDVGGGWETVRDDEVRLSDLTLYCMMKALKDSDELDVQFKDVQDIEDLKNRVIKKENIDATIHRKTFDPTIIVGGGITRRLESLLTPGTVSLDYSVKFRLEDVDADYNPTQLKELDIPDDQWNLDCYTD